MYCFTCFTYIFRFINSYLNSNFFHLDALCRCLLNNWSCHLFRRTKPNALPMLGSGPLCLLSVSSQTSLCLPGLHFQAYHIRVFQSHPPKGRDESYFVPSSQLRDGHEVVCSRYSLNKWWEKNMVTFLPGNRGLCGSDN